MHPTPLRALALLSLVAAAGCEIERDGACEFAYPAIQKYYCTWEPNEGE